MQAKVAESLAASDQTLELLLQLCEQGRANAALLTQGTIGQKVKAVASAPQSKRLTTLMEALPDEDSQLMQLIQERESSFKRHGGDTVAGKKLFETSCMNCHQQGGRGKVVGPNLDGIGNRGTERLMEDILAPNRNVDFAFRSTTIVTEDGKVFSGLARNLPGEVEVLVDQQGKEIRIPKDEVAIKKRSNLSPMPGNFSQTFTDTQLRDLMSYLLRLR